jgi:hypothetical protein
MSTAITPKRQAHKMHHKHKINKIVRQYEVHPITGHAGPEGE